LTADEIVNTWPQDDWQTSIVTANCASSSQKIVPPAVATRAEVTSSRSAEDRGRIRPPGFQRSDRITTVGARDFTGGLLVSTLACRFSLEDRPVKQFMQREARDCLCSPDLPACRCGHQAQLRIKTRKPIQPDESEVASNPRSRSAKLRIAERL
jgi:hypothetical protein